MKELFKSLSEFQQDCPIIHKGTKGFGYTYADLTAIIPIINPLLSKHGLSYTQLLQGSQLETIIFHIESGESLNSKIDIPQGVQLKGMNDFQVLGSAITYLRRYSLASALGLVTDKDLDACGVQEPKKEISVLDALKKCRNRDEKIVLWQSLTEDEQVKFKKDFESHAV